MEMESIVIHASITIFSVGLLVISLLSYQKYKNLKLLFISGVFLLFFIRGILLSLSLFVEEISAFTTSSYIWLFDLVMLILLFIATLKR
jgi:hypothetical protein